MSTINDNVRKLASDLTKGFPSSPAVGGTGQEQRVSVSVKGTF